MLRRKQICFTSIMENIREKTIFLIPIHILIIRRLLEDLPRQMIHDVDKSEVISENLIQSSRLGPIPPQWLSGGVKTLILIEHDNQHVFNASACGQNCAK